VLVVVRKGLFVVGKENEDRRLSRKDNKRENFELEIVAANCIQASEQTMQ
jgi:hypothetical protein